MPEDIIKIAHISDLHFGARGYKDVSHSLAEHLRLVVKPHLLLITGDLIHRAQRCLSRYMNGLKG
jgi:predicted MPP superfamily phosphohydrolase